MQSIPHYIYRWIDPRDNSVFYVGITVDLYQRYKQHMHCDGTNAQKDIHIREILYSGHLPIMQTIEQVESFQHALERESYWIRWYVQQGAKLANIASMPQSEPKPKGKYKGSYHAPVLPPGFIRYSTDRFLKKLSFRGTDGNMIGFTEVTGWQFIEYLSRYADEDWLAYGNPDSQFSSWDTNGWRCHWLNDFRIEGYSLEIYNHRGERVIDLIGNPLLPQTA